MHSQITQKQKNSLFLLRGKSPWLSPFQSGCSPKGRACCLGCNAPSVCRSPPQSPPPSLTCLGTSTNSFGSCIGKGQMEEDLLGETVTHFQAQESGTTAATSPSPRTLTLSSPDASEKGSRQWCCRVNSVGASQRVQPRISLWTEAIHCTMCWLIRRTFPRVA